MAHFAKIEAHGNRVLTVLTVTNKDVLNSDGVEEESVGQQYLEKHHNWPANKWIQNSYNTRNNKYYDNATNTISADQSKAFRGNHAIIGGEWDEANQIFWPVKPYPSWVKDTSDAQWHSPIGDAPDDLTAEEKEVNTHYIWNESGPSWDKIVNST